MYREQDQLVGAVKGFYVDSKTCIRVGREQSDMFSVLPHGWSGERSECKSYGQRR